MAKGRLRNAITLYQQVLVVDPADYVIRGKVARLFPKRKKRAEAWTSFVAAGEDYLREEERFDKALSSYCQAALPALAARRPASLRAATPCGCGPYAP